MNSNLYQRVIAITTDYLGPAASRFVDRQIQSHSGKKPGKLTLNDLDKLIDWSRIALAVITDDSDLVDEYIARLRALRDNDSNI